MVEENAPYTPGWLGTATRRRRGTRQNMGTISDFSKLLEGVIQDGDFGGGRGGRRKGDSYDWSAAGAAALGLLDNSGIVADGFETGKSTLGRLGGVFGLGGGDDEGYEEEPVYRRGGSSFGSRRSSSSGLRTNGRGNIELTPEQFQQLLRGQGQDRYIPQSYEVPGIGGPTGIYMGNGPQGVLRNAGGLNASASDDDLRAVFAVLDGQAPAVSGADRAALTVDGRASSPDHLPDLNSSPEFTQIRANFRRNGGLSRDTIEEIREHVADMGQSEKEELARSLNTVGSAFGMPRMKTVNDGQLAERLGMFAQMQAPDKFRQIKGDLEQNFFADMLSNSDGKAVQNLVADVHEASDTIVMATQQLRQAAAARQAATTPPVQTTPVETQTGFGGGNGVLDAGERGTDATRLQKALHDAGFGAFLGTSGRNGDGIDGDPKRLTMEAAKKAGSVMASLGVHNGGAITEDFVRALENNAGRIKGVLTRGA